jgi:hypothetical protein
LELAEWASIGGLILLQELENLLDSFRIELLADRVEILTLVLPEINLGQRIWVVSVLQGALWVLLEDVLDLLGPVNDGSFKKLSFVLARGLFA